MLHNEQAIIPIPLTTRAGCRIEEGALNGREIKLESVDPEPHFRGVGGSATMRG